MNIKTFMAAAVIALTAACAQEAPEAVETPVAEDAANTDAVDSTVEQPELDNGEVSPREVSEENPAVKPK